MRRGDERKLDRLPRDDHRTWLLFWRGDRLKQPIGKRLQPRKIDRRRRRLGWVRRRDLRHQHPARPAAKQV
jgi:hypothetical protein